MKTYIADGMLLVTAIVWGSGFVVTAIALEYLTAYQVMAGRFFSFNYINRFIWLPFKKGFEISGLEGSFIRYDFVYSVCPSNSWTSIYNTI